MSDSTNIPLLSTTGVDYSHLQNLLAEQNWEEADEQTYRVMQQAAGRPENYLLDSRDIETFPCQDLCIINNLWLQSSGSRFGFTVQCRVWHSVAISYATDKDELVETELKKYNNLRERFAAEVGWISPSKPKIFFKSDKQFAAQNLTSIPYGCYPLKALICRSWACSLIDWNVLFQRVEYCLTHLK